MNGELGGRKRYGHGRVRDERLEEVDAAPIVVQAAGETGAFEVQLTELGSVEVVRVRGVDPFGEDTDQSVDFDGVDRL